MRSQDTPLLLERLFGTPSAREAAWAFVQQEWTALTDKVGVFQSMPMIAGALGNFCSLDRAAEIRRFFAAHPMPEAARALAQALERIESCTAVRERQSAPFRRWLQR